MLKYHVCISVRNLFHLVSILFHQEDSIFIRKKNVLGLSFRPQIGGEGNIIVVNMKNGRNESDPYVKSLKQYLDVCKQKIFVRRKVSIWFSIRLVYWRQDRDRLSPTNKFTISNPGDCTAENQYGFSNGKPCILIKMNKVKNNLYTVTYKIINQFQIFNFLPKPGHMPEDEQAFKAAGCRSDPNAVAIHCYRDVINNFYFCKKQKIFLNFILVFDTC